MQATTVVINDGQATPVAVTFAPERVTPELTIFADRLTGISNRFRRISARFKPGNQATKTEISFSCPVAGILASGADGVVRTNRAKVSFELADGCTDAERKDIYAFVLNSLSNNLLRGVLRDLDPLY